MKKVDVRVPHRNVAGRLRPNEVRICLGEQGYRNFMTLLETMDTDASTALIYLMTQEERVTKLKEYTNLLELKLQKIIGE